VSVRQTMQVTGIDPVKAAVTTADGRRIEADYVIVTAGAWVTKLFPELTSDLTPWRTAVVYLQPPAHLAEAWVHAPVILDVGGKTDGYILPPSGEGGLKFGSGLHKFENPDADANREPVEGEGEAIRDLFAPPMRDIEQYKSRASSPAPTPSRRTSASSSIKEDRCLVVSACSGHGYKFGAAVGRRVAQFADSRDFAALRAWMRAEA
jgi:sarcosine oxidase